MPFSDEMIKRVAEAYRKVRNTCRYLLSNLYDFDPATDAVAEADLDELDRYALARHRQVVARVLTAYEEFEFHLVYHQLVQYCAVDLSAFYLDVLKDRLYCDGRDGHRRRSAQTVMRRIAEDLTLLMAPVLPFTADEVWPLLPGRAGQAVHLETFAPAPPPDAAVLERWAPLLAAREVVLKALEEARAAKQIAASLEARVALRADAAALSPCAASRPRARCSPATWPTSSS
jgi:isoleucyl-tRNA synthetase